MLILSATSVAVCKATLSVIAALSGIRHSVHILDVIEGTCYTLRGKKLQVTLHLVCFIALHQVHFPKLMLICIETLREVRLSFKNEFPPGFESEFVHSEVAEESGQSEFNDLGDLGLRVENQGRKGRTLKRMPF